MEQVKAEVVTHYRSALVEHIRSNGSKFAYGKTSVRLAKEFGFCYGVERAIDSGLRGEASFPPPNSRSTSSARSSTTRTSTSRSGTWA